MANFSPDVMEGFIHNMPAKEMILITEREEEKLITDTNENWTLKRTKQEQKLCMIKNCWQYDEMLTYWILEDYTARLGKINFGSFIRTKFCQKSLWIVR